MRNGLHTRAIIVLILIVGVLPQIALSDDIDIRGINFKQARPLPGESLLEVVAEPAHDSIAILEQDARVLKEFPRLRVKIVGFTDTQECHGSECIELSLRRAKYVRDWSISHGISSQQVSGPEGHGSAKPIDNNGTERGRARNRRAEIPALTYPNGKALSPLY